MDQEKLAEVRQHHEDDKGSLDGALQGNRTDTQRAARAHADRGWLLDAIAKAQAGEQAACPLVEVEVPTLAVGVRVRAIPASQPGEVDRPAGRITSAMNNGWIVQHDDGRTVFWPAARLAPEPITSRVFDPTPEEVAACAVLAEVAGMPEREAVLVLARKLTVDRQALALRGAEPKPQRPRVGPWVKMAAGVLGRFDDRGQQAASVDPKGGLPEWWAVRPLQEEARGRAWDGGLDEACAAADAVLREWADLDGEARANVLHVAGRSVTDLATSIKAALQPEQVKFLLGCLGGASITEGVRVWTEEQIREAWIKRDRDPSALHEVEGFLSALREVP